MESKQTRVLHNGRPVALQLGTQPVLDVAILAADTWAFVDHWLQVNRSDSGEARECWRQAERFAAHLPRESYEAHPLHLYYTVLNAVKALIIIRKPEGAGSFRHHGLSFELGSPSPSGSALPGKLKPGRGVFSILCECMGDAPIGSSLEELLASVPWVHRAWRTARPDKKDRYVPVRGAVRLRVAADEVFFEADLAEHANLGADAIALPAQKLVEIEVMSSNGGIAKGVRTRARLPKSEVGNNERFVEFHRQARRLFDTVVVREGHTHYMRRADNAPVDLSQITNTFAIALALSSLARYHPKVWRESLEGPNGWLLKEYLCATPLQFLALIAGEITGRIIQRPYSDLR